MAFIFSIVVFFISSPEPLGSLVSRAYSIAMLRRLFVCCLSTIFKDLLSKTAGTVKAKFHMEP